MTMGERLKFLRQARGLKQKEVATSLGLTQSSVANYETNFRKPPYDALIKLADFYGVATDFILRGTVPFTQGESKTDIREIPVVRRMSVDERDRRHIFKAISHYEPVLLEPEDKANYFYYPAGENTWMVQGTAHEAKLLVKEHTVLSDGSMILGIWAAEELIVLGRYFEQGDMAVIQPWGIQQRPYILDKEEMEKKLVLVGIVISVEFHLDKETAQEEQSGASFGKVR